MDVAGFVVLAGVLTVLPGQDTFLVLRNASWGGARMGVATSAGVCCGLFFHATLSALGVSALLLASARAYAGLRWLGAGYVVWLGVQSLLHLGRREVAASRVPGGLRRGFRQGLLSNLLNAKTAVFYLALLPQFAVVAEHVLRDSLVLAGIHFAMSSVWLVAISAVADSARARLARPGVRRAIDAVAGIALIGFGLRLAFERR